MTQVAPWLSLPWLFISKALALLSRMLLSPMSLISCYPQMTHSERSSAQHPVSASPRRSTLKVTRKQCFPEPFSQWRMDGLKWWIKFALLKEPKRCCNTTGGKKGPRHQGAPLQRIYVFAACCLKLTAPSKMLSICVQHKSLRRCNIQYIYSY